MSDLNALIAAEIARQLGQERIDKIAATIALEAERAKTAELERKLAEGAAQ